MIAQVLADTDTLKTLPPRELAAGLAEIVKYGVIVDAEFFAWLARFVAQVRRNWFVPMAAMTMRGHVVITFFVHKDGRITEQGPFAELLTHGGIFAALYRTQCKGVDSPSPHRT